MKPHRCALAFVLAAALPACGGGGSGTPPSGETVWSVGNPQNVAITQAMGNQRDPQIVTDGAGGAIIAWQDFRNGGSNSDYFARRVDAGGTVLWTVDGLGILTAPTSEDGLRLLSDGAGGAIFVWEEFQGATGIDLFAQRLNGSGAFQWPAGGKPLVTATGNQTQASLASDGAGGWIIAWTDGRGADVDVYAQRLNGSGAPLWIVDGVPLTAAGGGQGNPRLVSDGAGGAVAVWNDFRAGATSDLYGQRVNADGTPQWTADGVALTTAADEQRIWGTVPDGSGGVIAVWQDNRIGTFTDIYAGRLTGAGTAPWTADGVALSTAPGYQTDPRIASDGAGGALFAWMDENGGPAAAKVYAQRLNASGTPQWTATGRAMSTTLGRQTRPDVIPDGAGGGIVAWTDFRAGGQTDIYAQRFNAAGTPLWTVDGLPVCTETTAGQSGVRLTPNGFGGAILTWEDARILGTSGDIFAQGVSSGGQP